MKRNLMTIENKKKIRSGNQSAFCQKYEENTKICTIIFLKIDIQWTPHADCSTEVKGAYFQSVLCTLEFVYVFCFDSCDMSRNVMFCNHLHEVNSKFHV